MPGENHAVYAVVVEEPHHLVRDELDRPVALAPHGQVHLGARQALHHGFLRRRVYVNRGYLSNKIGHYNGAEFMLHPPRKVCEECDGGKP